MHRWNPSAKTREAFKIKYISASIQGMRPQLAAPLAKSRDSHIKIGAWNKPLVDCVRWTGGMAYGSFHGERITIYGTGWNEITPAKGQVSPDSRQYPRTKN